jgi:hypothetical protein
VTDPFDGDVEVAELHAAQVREWSKWEARDDITVGGARAAHAGMAVPQDNVERLGWAKEGKVRLQAGWIADNPDDDDVKTFLAWAKDHKDHPDARAWETFQAQRVETAEAAADDNPFAPKPETPTRTARRADAGKENAKAAATSTENKE